MKQAVVALFAAGALAACATVPPAETPGVVGKFDDGKAGALVRVKVMDAEAKTCSFGSRLPSRAEAGVFDFRDDRAPGEFRAPVNVVCTLASGEQVERKLQPVFDSRQFQINRTSTTVASALVSGPLALITGPLAAEMMRGHYYRVPMLVHVAPPSALADAAARERLHTEAAADWAELMPKLKTAAANTSQEGLLALRDADLALFASGDPAAPAEAPAPAVQ